MNLQKRRAIRIGIALNSANKENTPNIKEQYTTSDKMRNEVADILMDYGAEVVDIEANGNLFTQLSELAKDVDLIFNLAENIYQIAVPMAIAQVRLEKQQKYPVCTAASVEGHVLSLNKGLARQALSNRVQQPQWWYLGNNNDTNMEEINFPVIVKPTYEGHRIGINQASVVHSVEELNTLVSDLKKRFGKAILIESFLGGLEYSMGVVGKVVMPAVAWDLDDLPGQPSVRGEDLKQQDLTIPHAKIVRNLELQKAIARQVVTAHISLGLRDYSRSDFRARKGESIPCYIETNSAPGLVNNDSVLPWSASKAGATYRDIIGSIIAQALKRLPDDYRQQLNTKGFEDAYQRLCSLANHTISVQGQEYYLLMPQD